MKKSYLTLMLTSVFGFAWSQHTEKCGSHQAIQYQESLTPGYTQLVDEQFELAKSNLAKNNDLYTIPVVVHIVYNSPDQNLADSVVLNQLESLNADFQRRNADTINMRSDFDIVKGNPNIRFKLATIDPDGNPTTGITRTATSTASFGSFMLFFGDFSDLEKVKSTSDGGHDPWDQDRYLNIWVCNMEVFNTPAILGYATPPSGLPNWPPGMDLGLSDGVVVQYQAFGANNPNTIDMGQGPLDIRGRTLTHEVGHYLGLRHIWGDGNCSEEDGIDDTPNAEGQSDFDCDDSKNTCVDNIYGVDLPDMIENYMDYSAETCQNSFTQGQVDLMRGVLQNQRIDLVQNNPASIEQFALTEVLVFPNPTSASVTVRFLQGEVDQIRLMDGHGRLVEQVERNGASEVMLSLESLKQGVYSMVLLHNNTPVTAERIVKL
jgi:hypothetical protein